MPVSRIWFATIATDLIVNLIVTLIITLIITLTIGALNPSTSIAATAPPSPDLNEPDDNSPPATADEVDRARQVTLTQPPPIKKTERESDYFYRYRQALTVRGGVIMDLNNLGTLGSNLGFQYRFPFHHSQRIEIGADLMNEGAGVLHAARFHFFDDSRLRWFYKYGLGIRVVPAQQLVAFLKLANWQVRLGGGIEWTLQDPFSLRFDLETTVSSEKLTTISTVGAAYAW